MVAPNDDYDPKQSIQELSANLTQPDRFAEIFCSAAKTQKKIDDVLKENIKELLKKDLDITKIINQHIKNCNKEDWKSYGKKIGFAVWSIFLIALTTILTMVIERLFGK